MFAYFVWSNDSMPEIVRVFANRMQFSEHIKRPWYFRFYSMRSTAFDIYVYSWYANKTVLDLFRMRQHVIGSLTSDMQCTEGNFHTFTTKTWREKGAADAHWGHTNKRSQCRTTHEQTHIIHLTGPRIIVLSMDCVLLVILHNHRKAISYIQLSQWPEYVFTQLSMGYLTETAAREKFVHIGTSFFRRKRFASSIVRRRRHRHHGHQAKNEPAAIADGCLTGTHISSVHR